MLVHAQEERPGRQRVRPARTPAAPRVEPAGPLTPAQASALQRSVGNEVVSRLVGRSQGHDPGHDGHDGDAGPSAERELLDAALASPSRPLPEPLRAEAESFYRSDLSPTRVHDGPLAQRATAAMGAEAMTLGSHVFVAPGAARDASLMGHELGHVDRNLRGVRETGADNGAGVAVTDPDQRSERAAAADGAAFAAGAATAPSLAVRHAGPPAAADTAGPPAGPAPGPVQRMLTPRQRADEIDQAVRERWELAYGGGRQGRGPEDVRVRFARSYEDNRTAQTLSHQTFLMYDAIEGLREESEEEHPDEREVQGMLINNRLLFASNFNQSMDLLAPYTSPGEEDRDAYAEILEHHQSDSGRRAGLPGPDGREYVDRVNRADRKTRELLDGRRNMPEPSGPGGSSGKGKERAVAPDDATAEALRERHGKPVELLDIGDDELHTKLTDPAYEGAIFLVTLAADSGLVHAEQKLLLALSRSGIEPTEVKGAHTVIGRYRGCLCCTAALMYYKNQLGFGTMDFDPNPGFYYKESLENLYRHQAHVVGDPKFREYMMELAGGLPSTPALSRVAAPEHAIDNHGPETREPAASAARRNYRTPSVSEGEGDGDQEGLAYTSRRRDFDVPYAPGSTGGAKIGKGTAQVHSRQRAARIITAAADRENIQRTYLSRDPEAQAALFKHWENEREASRAELTDIVHEVDQERGKQAISSHIARLVKDRTGHEARDSRKAGDPVVRQPAKGKYAAKGKTEGRGAGTRKRGKKEMTKESSDWRTLLGIMQNDPKCRAFHASWLRARDATVPPYLEPAQMSDRLSDEVSELRTTYTVSSMARLLLMAERSLRRYLSDYYVDPDEAASAPPAQGPADDTEMMDVDTPPRRAWPRMTAAPRDTGGYGLRGEGGSTGYGYPDVPGYEMQYDQYGQPIYYDVETGAPHMYDPHTGRMTALDDRGDVEMSDARR